MGEWKLRELNKVDRPYKLLLWGEPGTGMLAIRKIKEEGFMIMNVSDDIKRIQKLKNKDQRRKGLANLPYAIESRIKKGLGIDGSLPYEIREWVSSVLIDWRLREERKRK
jgi:hypothetical protein